MFSPRVVLSLFLFSITASAQSVVSARSGVIHYSEGDVFVDNQRIEQKFARFDDVKQGSELRTENGKAEILLTPGTFLRVGENSAIRMISNRLSDTKVELLRGVASVESTKASPVTILCRDTETKFRGAGLYRFKADPSEVRVEQGEAEVTTNGKNKVVKQGEALAFSDSNAMPHSIADAGDNLDRWTMRRSIAVAADDAAANQAEDMAVLLDPPADPYGLGSPYGGVYSTGVGSYPISGYGSYLGTGLYGAPLFIPRPYYPGYYGYGGYRSGTLGLSPLRTVIPQPFHPPGRVFTTMPTRPTVSIPSAPRGGAVGHVPAGHR